MYIMTFPAGTRRNHNVIITWKYVTTSFWRNNDIIITSCDRWVRSNTYI